MTKRVFPWMLSAILFCGISAMMLTSCSANDNAVIITPSQEITGKWYAENDTPGTIIVDGTSINYQKVVQYANFKDEGTGFWSIIFVDENADAIDIPGHFCGGTFNYTVNGNTLNISMTSSGLPILENSWSATYSNDKIFVNAAEVANSLTPISTEDDLDCQRWLRQLGFGYSGELPMISEATSKDYGKVVCSEGHLHEAKKMPPEGCVAVGILGKVTKKGHGLIIALEDARSQTWNTINGWNTVSKYAGTKLKLLPDDNARSRDLPSFTKLGSTAVSDWCVAQKSDYSDIFKNLGSESSGKDGYVYDKNVNAYINIKKSIFEHQSLYSEYWTATESTRFDGWAFDDYWIYKTKSMEIHIRPVLGF